MTSSNQSTVTDSELKNCIKQKLKDCDIDHDKLFTKLQELGVNSVSDLAFLEESDLKDVLKPIQIRKFLKHVQEIPEEGTACQSTCSSSEQGSSPPQPQFKFQLFSLGKVLQEMPELRSTLQNEKRLPADMRRNFVRKVVDSVRAITHYCPKKGFAEIAQSIVRKYPNSFEDRIDTLRIGTGYDSLLKQFVSRNENMNRPYSQQKVMTRSGHETNQDSQDCAKNSTKRKARQDSYGCMNWGPSLSPEEEEEQDRIRLELVESYGALEPDFSWVKTKMDTTYPLLRKHINSGAAVPKLLEGWPFLIEKNILLAHCHQLLDIDLLDASQNFFLKKGMKMLRFFQSKTPDLRQFAMIWDFGSLFHQTPC